MFILNYSWWDFGPTYLFTKCGGIMKHIPVGSPEEIQAIVDTYDICEDKKGTRCDQCDERCDEKCGIIFGVDALEEENDGKGDVD